MVLGKDMIIKELEEELAYTKEKLIEQFYIDYLSSLHNLYKLRNELENSSKLGEWEVNKAKKLTMFQPGIYCLDQTVKSRGMEKSKKIKVGS